MRVEARAYYNDSDRKAAAWLRELIAAGHLPAGDVDERSICDVQPDDLDGYCQCHFFAGIGGWPYALRLAGWPDSWPIWTGSCPCQPLSGAGKRKGHVDERHLWPAFHRLIAERRPAIVFGEQVAGKDGLEWYAAVRADLEAAGYASGAADLCAAGAGAPHIRQRLYWGAQRLAAAGLDGPQGRVFRRPDARREIEHGSSRHYGAIDLVADADGGGRGIVEAVEPPHDGGQGRYADLRVGDGGLADAGIIGQSGSRIVGRPSHPEATPYRQVDRTLNAGGRGGLADADSEQRGRLADGQGRDIDRQEAGRLQGDGEPQSSGLVGRMANADGGNAGAEGLQRGGQHRQQPQDGGSGDAAYRWPGASHDGWRDADWLYCRDGKWRPVEPGTFPLAARIPARMGRLRGYGNAIVPQVAVPFILAWLDTWEAAA